MSFKQIEVKGHLTHSLLVVVLVGSQFWQRRKEEDSLRNGDPLI